MIPLRGYKISVSWSILIKSSELERSCSLIRNEVIDTFGSKISRVREQSLEL